MIKRIYLDANGSCPALICALEKIKSCLMMVGNPSSFHEEGRRMGELLSQARKHVAHGLEAKDKNVIFCSGASEANRLFIHSLVQESHRRGQSLQVLISPFEHPSLLKPAQIAEAEGHFLLKYIKLDPLGHIQINSDLDSFDVVICTQAHNETGILPDLAVLISYLNEKTIFMSDISQAYARLMPVAARADVLTFSAQKMGALAGAGGLLIRGRALNLPAPWPGGGQERGIRPGTEASLLIAAMGEAAKFVQDSRKSHSQLAQVRDYFEQKLATQCDMKIVGKNLARLPNTSAITFLGQDADALRIACDMAGLAVGFGSACSGLAPEGSFALKKLGLSLDDEKCTVRFSLPINTTFADMDEVIHRLKTMVLS